jgi:hypothetical protein
MPSKTTTKTTKKTTTATSNEDVETPSNVFCLLEQK